MAALNKQNLADTFQTFKGRFKHMKVKADKKSTNEVMQDEKGDSVDQIKKKYGYTSAGVSIHVLVKNMLLNTDA